MKNRIYVAALIALLLFTAAFTYQSKPRQWEYHTEIFGKISEGKLNELGSEGWELAGVGSANGVNQFVFKRPKS